MDVFGAALDACSVSSAAKEEEDAVLLKAPVIIAKVRKQDKIFFTRNSEIHEGTTKSQSGDQKNDIYLKQRHDL